MFDIKQQKKARLFCSLAFLLYLCSNYNLRVFEMLCRFLSARMKGGFVIDYWLLVTDFFLLPTDSTDNTDFSLVTWWTWWTRLSFFCQRIAQKTRIFCVLLCILLFVSPYLVHLVNLVIILKLSSWSSCYPLAIKFRCRHTRLRRWSRGSSSAIWMACLRPRCCGAPLSLRWGISCGGCRAACAVRLSARLCGCRWL